MFTKIIYSLANKNKQPHSDIVYKMFYVSMRMAKEVRCEIELWGTSDAIQRLGGICDNVINIDNIDYKLWDDIKIKILEQSDTPILDGDIFLYHHPKFGNELSVDMFVKGHTNQNALDDFNSFNPMDIIPYWDVNNTKAFGTGFISWKNNDELKREYIESYKKLRDWYFKKESQMVEKNEYLSTKYSVISHIICENLMYQFASHNNMECIALPTINKYDHWHGDSKYMDSHKIRGISLLYDMIVDTNQSVEDAYRKLIANGFKPFLQY